MPDTATGTAGADAGEAMVLSAPNIYLKAFCEHESSCTHQLIPGDSGSICCSDLGRHPAPAVGQGRELLFIRVLPDTYRFFMLFVSFSPQPGQVYLRCPV